MGGESRSCQYEASKGIDYPFGGTQNGRNLEGQSPEYSPNDIKIIMRKEDENEKIVVFASLIF